MSGSSVSTTFPRVLTPIACACALLTSAAADALGEARSPGTARAVAVSGTPARSPVLGTPDWSVVDPQALSQFGGEVSTAGDVDGDGFSDVLVAAWSFDTDDTNAGRVSLYLGSPSGPEATPSWIFDGDQPDAFLGHAAATAGDVNGDGYDDVVIGAFGHDGEVIDEGRTYVFHGSPEGLEATPAWVTGGGQEGAWFGYAAATAGDVDGDGYDDVVIGAYYYDGGETDEGRVFVYLGSPDGLSPSPAWTVDGDVDHARFGNDVGTAGDVDADGFSDVIVGCRACGTTLVNEGRAFVYHGSATGLSPTPSWSVAGGQAGAELGTAVGTAGDIDGDGYADVVVGVPRYDGGETDEGRFDVYRGSAAGLAAAPSYTTESNQAGAEMGRSVATAGDVDGDGLADVTVGAPGYDVLQADDGIAYVFEGRPSGTMAQIWAGFSDELGARFGEAVGTAGDVDGDGFSEILVGASGVGRASVYRGLGGTLSPVAAAPEGDALEAEHGHSVASAGDVNGDGYSDVIVGAHFYHNGATSKAGRAVVYHGSETGIETSPTWSVVPEGDDAWWLGHSVASAGDVNGDGYADVIVGAPFRDGVVPNDGAAFVYHGSPAGLATSPSWQFEGGLAQGRFGWSVASAGDINGDGYADVVVGAPAVAGDEDHEGAAYAFLGSPEGLGTAVWSVQSNIGGTWLGYSVGTAGDVDGDGYSDVLVGMPGYPLVETGAGAVRLYRGSPAGLGPGPDWFVSFDQPLAQLGYSVGTAGDVNGDGYADVIVGALHAADGHDNEGMAFVYHGSSSGLDTTPDWVTDGDQANAHYGYSVATAGDINGDGYADVIVGAILYEVFSWNEDEGKAFVYLGSETGLRSSYDVASRLEGGQPGAYLGVSVGTAGDVNGDGFSDVVVGASRYADGHVDEGRALVHLGNRGDGVARRPQQARSDDSAPIAPFGRSDSPSSFLVKALGRSPGGRDRVRLQVEVEPAGVPFDGGGLLTGTSLDSGIAGAELGELVTGLTAATPYHWRLRILSSSPYFPRSPWLSIPGNALGETDLRTAFAQVSTDGLPAPIAGVGLAVPRPNPFHVATHVAFSLERPGLVRLAIYDVAGREVVRLADGPRDAGRHAVSWDGLGRGGRRAAAGVYVLRLDAGGETLTRKIVRVH